jgi:hypothetical protein
MSVCESLELFLKSSSPKSAVLVGRQNSGKTELVHQLQICFEKTHRFCWMQYDPQLELRISNFITTKSIDEMFSKSTMRKKVLVIDEIDTWPTIPNVLLETMKTPKVHVIVLVEHVRKVSKLVKLASEVISMDKSSKVDSEDLDMCKHLVTADFETVRRIISNDGIRTSNTIYESLTDSQVPLRCWIANMSPLLVWSNHNFEPAVLEVYLLCVVYMTVLVGKVSIQSISTIPSRYANASFMQKRNALQRTSQWLTRFDQLAIQNSSTI